MSAWKKPLRVAAYCRVSTDSDDQANSFESQQRYFRAYIAQQPHWELAGIFADEGLSGTSTKKRLAFQPASAWSSIKCSTRRSWGRST